jgi:hypothetical protein
MKIVVEVTLINYIYLDRSSSNEPTVSINPFDLTALYRGNHVLGAQNQLRTLNFEACSEIINSAIKNNGFKANNQLRTLKEKIVLILQ